MRVHSVARVAACQDVCIFCACRSRSSAPRPRILRSFSTTKTKTQSKNDTSASQSSTGGPLGGGWGGLGKSLGGTDFDKPLELPSKPRTDVAQSSVTKEAGKNNLRDIIPPRRPPRPRQYEQRQESKSDGVPFRRAPIKHGRDWRPAFLSNASPGQIRLPLNAQIDSRQDAARSIQQPDTKDTATTPPETKVGGSDQHGAQGKSRPPRGTVGGLDDLLSIVDTNSRYLEDQKHQRRSLRSGRKPVNDFEDNERAAVKISWTPSEEGRYGSDDDDLDVDPAELLERRRGRFGNVAAEPSRPKYLSGRTKEAYGDYDPTDEDRFYEDRRRRRKKGKGVGKGSDGSQARGSQQAPQVAIPDFIGIDQLSKLLRVPLEGFIRHLEDMGFESPSRDHILDGETAALIANEYNYTPVLATSSGADLVARPPPEDKSLLPPRPPIITIMGHVDHGKTTILDYLRKSSVAASEHGGITQHIGAFSVRMPGVDRLMTFLDTPGHAAFLEMRRRGANVTDIVVLVVAADDGVKPQTIEAIKHALAANVQIVVAISKVDKHDADVENIKHELTRYGIEVEDLGGNVQAIPVSGKTGQGMQDLEEAILALSEAEDYRAEIDGPAEGWVIESHVTQAGRLATILVRRGTLRPGDYVVAGTTWTRIRSLRDDAGQLIAEAPPGTPVQVDGWRDQPHAGLEVLQAESENQAKEVTELRIERDEMARLMDDATAINAARKEEAEQRARRLAWEATQERYKRHVKAQPRDNAGWVEPENDDSVKKVNVVVKADVTGSVEAVVDAISQLGNNEVRANIIRSGVGQVNLSDIQHVSATGEYGVIISFNQGTDGEMYRLAENAGVEILDHNIIYRVIDAVRDKLSDQLPPLIKHTVEGEAEVLQVFDIMVKKEIIKIAGCKITNGTINKESPIRVSRDNQLVFDGKLSSLKNVKKDVDEMRKGSECGMGFENWSDFMVGDTIQCYREIREKRKL